MRFRCSRGLAVLAGIAVLGLVASSCTLEYVVQSARWERGSNASGHKMCGYNAVGSALGIPGAQATTERRTGCTPFDPVVNNAMGQVLNAEVVLMRDNVGNGSTVGQYSGNYRQCGEAFSGERGQWYTTTDIAFSTCTVDSSTTWYKWFPLSLHGGDLNGHSYSVNHYPYVGPQKWQCCGS